MTPRNHGNRPARNGVAGGVPTRSPRSCIPPLEAHEPTRTCEYESRGITPGGEGALSRKRSAHAPAAIHGDFVEPGKRVMRSKLAQLPLLVDPHAKLRPRDLAKPSCRVGVIAAPLAMHFGSFVAQHLDQRSSTPAFAWSARYSLDIRWLRPPARSSGGALRTTRQQAEAAASRHDVRVMGLRGQRAAARCPVECSRERGKPSTKSACTIDARAVALGRIRRRRPRVGSYSCAEPHVAVDAAAPAPGELAPAAPSPSLARPSAAPLDVSEHAYPSTCTH